MLVLAEVFIRHTVKKNDPVLPGLEPEEGAAASPQHSLFAYQHYWSSIIEHRHRGTPQKKKKRTLACDVSPVCTIFIITLFF